MELERPFLNGKNIFLQPMDISFLDSNYLNWVNDDEIIDNMASLSLPTTEKGLREYIENNTNRSDVAFFAIRWKENSEFIGTIKLGPIDWIDRKAYYGQLVGKKYWGKGVGTEALRLLVSYGFNRLNLHWIGAAVIAENKASIKSSERAGFTLVATIPNQIWYKGRYTAMLHFGITSDEFYAQEKCKNDT